MSSSILYCFTVFLASVLAFRDQLEFINDIDNEIGDGIKIQSMDHLDVDLPDNFDSREAWPHCKHIIGAIRDQADCGSCWAVASASAISDRICIHTNGKKQVYVSAEDILGCAGSGSCAGGSSAAAFKYWATHGVVSGGEYGSNLGCKPYSISPCGRPGQNKCLNDITKHLTPICIQRCREGYGKSYESDLFRGQPPQGIQGEINMKKEIFANGPIVSLLEMFSDFDEYKGGVYEHKYGVFKYNHFVKILGWGIENGQNYWLAANSNGTDFGLGGFIKILRGKNHLGIEGFSVAGLPIPE